MTLPHSPEAERGFIAKLLVDPSGIPALVGSVEPEDFDDETLGAAWRVMVDNAADARRLDLTVLKSKGVDLGDPTEFYAYAKAPAAEYAGIIRTDATKRRAILALKGGERQVRSATSEAGVYEAVQQSTAGVLSQHRGGTLRTLADAIKDYRPREGTIEWGFPSLDRALPPMSRGEMVVVAARANVGKSAFVLDLSLKMSRDSELPVLFTSVEMSEHNIITRLSHRGLNPYRTGHNLIIDDDPNASVASIRAKAARLRLQHGGVKAIVIDYLQLLTGPGETDYARVTRISREVKALAREFDCTTIPLAQFNRQGEAEGRKPRLSDLRDSGAIEQDADVVLGLWRPGRGSPEMTVMILKHRNAPAGGEVHMYFDLNTVSVGEE